MTLPPAWWRGSSWSDISPAPLRRTKYDPK
jgi:hypothetical protein